MHRSRTLALIACGAALAPAAPAAGDVPLRDDPRARAVALSGPDVLVARTGRHGRVAVDALPRAGGAARRLLTVPSHGQREDAPRLAASPQRWAVLVQLEAPSGAAESRLYAGSPGGPASLVLRSRWLSRRAWVPIDVAVDGEQLLLLEVQPERGRTRARVFAPDAARATVPWPGHLFGETAIGRGRFELPAGTRRRVHVRLTRRGVRYVLRRLGTGPDPLLDGVFLDLGARVRDGRVPAELGGRGVVIGRRAARRRP